MFIKKVQIYGILGIHSANLTFEDSSPIYIVQCAKNCLIRSSFSTAIELIFSSKYATKESLASLGDTENGLVCITFLIPRKSGSSVEEPDDAISSNIQSTSQTPSTSKKAAFIAKEHLVQDQRSHLDDTYQVFACRNFCTDSADIIYCVNNGPKEKCSLAAFHGKFRTNVNLLFPFLEKSNEMTQSGNLLKYIVEHINFKWFQNYKTFSALTSSFKKAKRRRSAFLKRHTTVFLNTVFTNNAALKLNILKICQHIRTIFEYITCQKYTVWFFIPCQRKYVEIDKVILENLDIDTIETCVQVKNCKTPRLITWTEVENGIKELLLVTLDITVAFYCKKELIIINQTDLIKEYQSMEFSTSAYLQKFNEVGNNDWIKNHYLQRIIDVCNSIKITAIIEYSGGFPMPPTNANIIKCLNEPPYMIVSNIVPYNIDNHIERIEMNLL